MLNIKLVISLMLVLFTIFSTTGSAFAGATIGVTFDKNVANVGDTVNLIITIKNTGPDDLSDVSVLAPFPNGLELLSFSTGTSKNNYDIGSGIWQVDNLRLTSRGGGVKTLTITARVGSELAGKKLIAIAKYQSVYSGVPPIQLTDINGSSATLNVLSNQTINSTGNTTNSTGIKDNNESTSNNTHNNTDNIITTNNTDDILINGTVNLNNLNKTNGTIIGKNDQILDQPSGNAYEVYNNPPESQNNPLTVYTIGLLAIIGLIAIGYFYGVKK
jgi:uncharacterized repeat protein (TIGR01451 family)